MGEAKAPVEEAVQRADDDVALFRSEPQVLAHLRLGRFSDAGVRSLLVRRLLLRVPVPLGLLASLPAPLAARVTAFAGEVAYWRRAKALLSRAEWASLTHGPVILMYHALGSAGEPASRYVLPEPRFRRQVAWLRARGYRLAPVRELVVPRTEGELPQARSVVITFDDGYRDNGPALSQAGIPATVFVVTGSLGGSNRWDRGGHLAGRALLSWDEARRLVEAGVEIGAHTRSHPLLPDLPAQRLDEEVQGSLDDLQRELGPGAYTFAYPHGRFDVRTEAAVAAAGFAGACCSRGGVNDPYVPSLEMRRVEIKGTDSFLSFVLMVWLGRRITPLQFLRSLIFG
jgi:peptidoglycan/xylan/chitin deacetylase (PgdA/CDA1 family)